MLTVLLRLGYVVDDYCRRLGYGIGGVLDSAKFMGLSKSDRQKCFMALSGRERVFIGKFLLIRRHTDVATELKDALGPQGDQWYGQCAGYLEEREGVYPKAKDRVKSACEGDLERMNKDMFQTFFMNRDNGEELIRVLQDLFRGLHQNKVLKSISTSSNFVCCTMFYSYTLLLGRRDKGALKTLLVEREHAKCLFESFESTSKWYIFRLIMKELSLKSCQEFACARFFGCYKVSLGICGSRDFVDPDFLRRGSFVPVISFREFLKEFKYSFSALNEGLVRGSLNSLIKKLSECESATDCKRFASNYGMDEYGFLAIAEGYITEPSQYTIERYYGPEFSKQHPMAELREVSRGAHPALEKSSEGESAMQGGELSVFGRESVPRVVLHGGDSSLPVRGDDDSSCVVSPLETELRR